MILLASPGFLAGQAFQPGKEDPAETGPVISQIDSVSQCPGELWVPVRVYNGYNLGSISLRFSFDTAVVKYQNVYDNLHPGLIAGFLVVGNNPETVITIAWYALNPFSIHNDTLLRFKFMYYGGETAFGWDEVNCEYSAVDPQIIYPGQYEDGEVNSETFLAEITNQPVDENVCENTDASFTVETVYDLLLQWQISTDGGTTWNDLANNAIYSGVDNNTLMITAVPLSFNNNKYRCIASGICPPDPVTDTVTLTVQTAPGISAGPDDSICAGQTFTVNGTATNYSTVTWSTSGDGSFSPANALTSTYTPGAGDLTNGQAVLTMSISGVAPCEIYEDSLTLTIHPIPVANAGNDTTVCQGGFATLHGSGGSSYTWNTIPPQTTPVIVVNPTVQTTYTLTVSEFGCTDTDQVTVYIEPGPLVSAGNDASICADETYTLIGSVQNVSDYQWVTTGDGSFSDPGLLNPVYTPGPGDLSTGFTYLVITGLPNAPCILPDRDTMMLTLIPLPNAQAGNNVDACFGDTVILTATGGSGYIWSTVPPSATQSVSVTPPVTTTYYVTVSNLQCAAVDSVRVTVMPLPVIQLTNDTMICSGHSITLAASGGLSYLWSTNDFTSSITVSPTVTTTYYVTVTDINTCHAVDSVKITVNASLTGSLVPANPTICQGDSIMLTASANHPSTFSWTPSTGLSAATGPVIWAYPVLTTAYRMTATDAMGCAAHIDFSVVVHQTPPVEVHPPAYNLCKGDTIILTAYGANTYYWEPSTGLSSNTLPSVYCSPRTSVVYNLTGTDLHGCSKTVQAVINVHPVPLVNLPSGMIVCRGEKYLLDGSGHLDSCTYFWQDGSSHPFLYVYEPGLYWVTVDRNGCSITDTTEILPCSEIFVPNAFTPNNDGINDLFRVSHTGDIMEFEITVYNRWGERVFHSQDVNEPWDGTMDGEKCPVGVYHYVIEYLGQGNVLLEQEGKKHGQITLFR